MSSVSWLSFSISKAGNSAAENEDAVFPEQGFGQDGKRNLVPFLVADGATQTSFSGLWARCLVNAFSDTHLSEFAFLQGVKKAQKEWQSSLQNIELPWHAQEKFRQGAFSALTWLEISYDPLHPSSAYSWRALAVGDCCLFISRAHSIYLSLPIQHSSEFTNSPVLIPSKDEKMGTIKGKTQMARGALKNGDHVLLSSDALSAWLINQPVEEQILFIKFLREVLFQKKIERLTKFVNTLRRNNKIKNDDTSLVFIELGEIGL